MRERRAPSLAAEQLLAGPDRESQIANVTADGGDLPARFRRLWKRILDARQ